jgi:alpha/beta superfamily hydrolase
VVKSPRRSLLELSVSSDHGMAKDSLFLRGPTGRLEAIYRRVTRVRAAVFCHSHPGNGGSMFDKVLHAVACALHDAGVSTLRFNLRGIGESDGRFDGGLAEGDDVRSAIDHAARDHDDVAVVGFSFGAWLGLRVGLEDARVSRLVGLAVPIDVLDFSYLSACSKRMLLVQGERDKWGAVGTLRSALPRIGNDARLHVISGGDHWFGSELRPVVAAVVEFLREPTGAVTSCGARTAAR